MWGIRNEFVETTSRIKQPEYEAVMQDLIFHFSGSHFIRMVGIFFLIQNQTQIKNHHIGFLQFGSLPLLKDQL